MNIRALHAGNYRLNYNVEIKWLFLSSILFIKLYDWRLDFMNMMLTVIRLQVLDQYPLWYPCFEGTTIPFFYTYPHTSQMMIRHWAPTAFDKIGADLWKEMPFCGRPRKPRPLIATFYQQLASQSLSRQLLTIECSIVIAWINTLVWTK